MTATTVSLTPGSVKVNRNCGACCSAVVSAQPLGSHVAPAAGSCVIAMCPGATLATASVSDAVVPARSSSVTVAVTWYPAFVPLLSA
jgi:hypothetical protein